MRSSTFNFTVLFLLAAVSAFACCSTTYDNTLVIGSGAGTACATGCAPNPNPVPANHLDIYNASGSPVDITRLIIGIPSTAGGVTPPVISQVGIYNPYTGGLDSTSFPNLTATGCGTLTSASGNPYNGTCNGQGVSLTNNETWANWSSVNPGATSFALYSYNLSSLDNLSSLGLYDISLGAALPIGTIEIAFGIAPTGAGGNAICYLTGWNDAGRVVPEPASWLLVTGAGLALLGGRRLKKSRS
jgi:hypothetical protein